jgi:hypothetical protein
MTPDENAHGDVARLNRSARLVLAALVALVGLLYAVVVSGSSFVINEERYFSLGDDAMISMRYAYNAAHGHGFVWNVGERVQGYSNLGWTLVMTVVHFLGLPLRLNSLVLLVINAALHAGIVALVFGHLRPRVSPTLAAVGGALAALNYPLLIWGTAGFENTLQTLLITAALLPLVPDPSGDADIRALARVPWLCAAAFLVRSDAGLFLVTAGGCAALLAIRSGSAVVARRVFLGLAGAAVVIASVFLWQKSYYGDFLPNTFRLKASSDTRDLRRGLKYLWRLVVSDRQAGVALGAAWLLVSGLLNPRRADYAPLALILGSWAAYLVWVGGDVFGGSRFFTPVLPTMIVCTVLVLHGARLEPTSARGLRALRAALALLLTVGLIWMPWRTYVEARGMYRSNLDGVAVARTLERLHLAPDNVVATFHAGTTPYFLPGTRFLDILGKTDAHIARTRSHWGPPGHNKWDFDYVFLRVVPRVIVGVAATESKPRDELERWLSRREDFGFDPAIQFYPEFRQHYLPYPVETEPRVPFNVRRIYVRDGRPQDVSTP